jgi:hypothetical protein
MCNVQRMCKAVLHIETLIQKEKCNSARKNKKMKQYKKMQKCEAFVNTNKKNKQTK